MDGERCRQKDCAGKIQDGYCDSCGHVAPKSVPPKVAVIANVSATVNRKAPIFPPALKNSFPKTTHVKTGTGSSPVSRAASGSRRTAHPSAHTTRKQLGAGLITLPDLPSADPEKTVLASPVVPENKRYCPNCNAALRREAGFCGKCGRRYNFVPSLKPGDTVAGQYEVRGAIAYGGLGWIYLGFDNLLSRYVVLKGLLNTLDQSSAAVAVAERQFLAAVKHPNIVGIYNFVQHAGEGFIVMEFVGGKTLKQIRKERGPLPVAEAVAYIHRIVPSFAYMHSMGLVYCDFKPDNVMLERDDVKLIDLGGVRRIDDNLGDIYGTVGYSAPEAGAGPTPSSDLFTVGRTLAVLLIDIAGFSKEHTYTLPTPQEQPLFAEQESLYRFLLRATAQDAADRFESADEMTEQLYGVLREVVAKDSGKPRLAPSRYFGGDLLAIETGSPMLPVFAEARYLPMPALDTVDPGVQAVTAAATLPDPGMRVGALRVSIGQYPGSRAIRLQLAGALADAGSFDEAIVVLRTLGEEDPWDWRVQWQTGRMFLLKGDATAARREFDRVYFDLPGETAPKLALAFASELAADADLAERMFQSVWRTDSTFVSAAFGLARCLLAKGNRQGAYETLLSVPQGSGIFGRAQVAAARTLIQIQPTLPGPEDISAAGTLSGSLPVTGADRCTLDHEILQTALQVAQKGKVDRSKKIFDFPFEEKRLRTGLERSFREQARLAAGEERVRLVDQANAIRPRTLF